MIADHPWLGIGRASEFGREWLGHYDPDRWRSAPEFPQGAPCAHNDALQLAAIHGIPFLIIAIALPLTLLWTARNGIRLGCPHARFALVVLLGAAASTVFWDPSISAGWWNAVFFVLGVSIVPALPQLPSQTSPSIGNERTQVTFERPALQGA